MTGKRKKTLVEYDYIINKKGSIMNNRPSGSIPRKTTINDQPHMLAYINPQEAMMLKSMGGSGQPGPGGIPAFYYGGDFGEGGRGAGNSGPGESRWSGSRWPRAGPGVSGGGRSKCS